jgi:hypothetical protein
VGKWGDGHTEAMHQSVMRDAVGAGERVANEECAPRVRKEAHPVGEFKRTPFAPA